VFLYRGCFQGCAAKALIQSTTSANSTYTLPNTTVHVLPPGAYKETLSVKGSE
jgi:hypothetical protein